MPCAREEMVLVASPRHRKLARRRTIRAAELAGMRMILFNTGTDYPGVDRRVFSARGYSARSCHGIGKRSHHQAARSRQPRREPAAAGRGRCGGQARRTRSIYASPINGSRAISELCSTNPSYQPKPLLELIGIFSRHAAMTRQAGRLGLDLALLSAFQLSRLPSRSDCIAIASTMLVACPASTGALGPCGTGCSPGNCARARERPG